MRTVHKFILPVMHGDTIRLSMPADAQFLSIQEQHGEVCLWALVDTAKPGMPRNLLMVGTGHPLPPGYFGRYIDSVQLIGGSLVLHFFDLDARPGT